MTLLKDYSWCPPKKRPIPVLSPEPTIVEVDENEEPQDLSLKTRQRLKDYPPTPLPPRGVPTSLSAISLPHPRPMISVPPSFPRDLIGGPSSLSPSYRVGSSGTEGLQLISEIASKVEGYSASRDRILTPPLQNKEGGIGGSVYRARTPRSPARMALGERGRWAYHPYLPLVVYGLPSPPCPQSKSSLPKPPPVEEPVRPLRSGSTSPPGEPSVESSSGSEGSPELRGEKLSCPDCGRGYATLAGLSRHQQFHCLRDASRTFACKHCAKAYTSVGALKMHIRTHTLPCKCHVCGKAFSRPWLLQGHIRTHTGEKPFECHQCHRSFADRSNLRAHLQTHEDIKKYACTNCPKTFSRMSLLVKHQDHGCPGLTLSRPLSATQIPIVSPL